MFLGLDRKKIIIISLAVLAVVIIILAILFFMRQPEPVEVDLGDNQQQAVTGDTLSRQISELPAPSPRTVEAEQSYPIGLRQLAFSFAERFGTYSSHSDFKSFEDLRPLVTDSFGRYLDSLIIDSQIGSTEYEAYNTKALSGDLVALDDAGGRAEIMVKTQRTHYVDAQSEPVIFYQSISIKFIKVGGDWKINEAYWQ